MTKIKLPIMWICNGCGKRYDTSIDQIPPQWICGEDVDKHYCSITCLHTYKSKKEQPNFHHIASN